LLHVVAAAPSALESKVEADEAEAEAKVEAVARLFSNSI